MAQERKRNAAPPGGVQSIQSVRRAAQKNKAAGFDPTSTERQKVPIPTSSAALVHGEVELNLLLLWGTNRVPAAGVKSTLASVVFTMCR
jgi:hypothetical protein